MKDKINMYLFHAHEPGCDFFKLLTFEDAVTKMLNNISKSRDVLDENVYLDMYDDLIIGRDIMEGDIIPDNETEKIMQFMGGYLIKKLEKMLKTPEAKNTFQVFYEGGIYETIVLFENNTANI